MIEIFLEVIAKRTPYFLLLVGLVILFIAIIPFRFERNGWSIRSPASVKARSVAGVIGLGAITVSIVLINKTERREIQQLSETVIASYFSFVSIQGDEAACVMGECVLAFKDSMLLHAPEGKMAIYKGRIKTSGRIVKFKTSPRYVILNPEQFPANPTYVEFSISPSSGSDRKLEAKGDLVVRKTFTPNSGKIGVHFPYFTNYAVALIDLRSLDMNINAPIETKLESPNMDGALVSGHVQPHVNQFENGKIYAISASDIPAGSSIVLSWDREE